MVKQVTIKNFSDVTAVTKAASQCFDDIGVHDVKGVVADAKSILGLMNLDYSQPVKLVSESAKALEIVSSVLS